MSRFIGPGPYRAPKGNPGVAWPEPGPPTSSPVPNGSILNLRQIAGTCDTKTGRHVSAYSEWPTPTKRTSCPSIYLDRPTRSGVTLHIPTRPQRCRQYLWDTIFQAAEQGIPARSGIRSRKTRARFQPRLLSYPGLSPNSPGIRGPRAMSSQNDSCQCWSCCKTFSLRFSLFSVRCQPGKPRKESSSATPRALTGHPGSW